MKIVKIIAKMMSERKLPPKLLLHSEDEGMNNSILHIAAERANEDKGFIALQMHREIKRFEVN